MHHIKLPQDSTLSPKYLHVEIWLDACVEMFTLIFISGNQSRYPEVYNTHTHPAHQPLTVYKKNSKKLIYVFSNLTSHCTKYVKFLQKHSIE